MNDNSPNIDSVDDEQVEFWEITEAEWREAANRSLRRIGLTYDELARQAKDDRFDSVDAMLVWRMVLNGRRP